MKSVISLNHNDENLPIEIVVLDTVDALKMLTITEREDYAKEFYVQPAKTRDMDFNQNQIYRHIVLCKTRDKVYARSAEWAAKNPEKHKETNRKSTYKWEKEHPEEYKQTIKRYAEANKDELARKHKAYLKSVRQKKIDDLISQGLTPEEALETIRAGMRVIEATQRENRRKKRRAEIEARMQIKSLDSLTSEEMEQHFGQFEVKSASPTEQFYDALKKIIRMCNTTPSLYDKISTLILDKYLFGEFNSDSDDMMEEICICGKNRTLTEAELLTQMSELMEKDESFEILFSEIYGYNMVANAKRIQRQKAI
jgi:hypothetical protein